MKSAIFLGFVATALSAAIEKRQPEAEPQVSGGLDGFVPGASGFLNGLINGATAIGTLGGIAINPLATPTPAAKRDPQLLSGGLSGFVPDASGFLEGLINGPTAAGTLGGIAINPLATPTPAIKERDPQLLSGGLSGFVPDASGFLEGLINGPTASGQLGGIAIDPLALETPAPSEKLLEAPFVVLHQQHRRPDSTFLWIKESFKEVVETVSSLVMMIFDYADCIDVVSEPD
ncbi:hypothetical protein MRB53_041593 [Persea americana]|nr:hypothetical protein MRB53_041593 [Persea americana]